MQAPVPPLDDVVKQLQHVDEDRKALRAQAMEKLSLLLKVWARMVVYQLGHPDEIVTRNHLKLCPFGSFTYEDTSHDSDIDLLCVSSRFITRKNFFHDLRRLFTGMKGVEGFTVIMSAFVPIMKMKFHGVAMDICFTQLNCKQVPKNFDLDYISNINMTLLDDKSIASMNGYIMTSKIARIVPDFKSFTSTLNIVKLWAKRRRVYSALLGFLSGSSLSILVAKICQLNPKASVPNLVSGFFQVYSTWDWTTPIALDDPSSNTKSNQPWVTMSDCSRDVVRVMTPLSPPTNTARNVSRSSLAVLREELRTAADTIVGRTESRVAWEDLFQEETPKEFFCRYPVFVQVMVGGVDEGDRKWEGYVKSRLPGLVKSLEQHENVERAHLNTFQFVQRANNIGEPETTCMFIGLELDSPSPLPAASTAQFVNYVSTWREFDATRMGVHVDFVSRDAIPAFVYT